MCGIAGFIGSGTREELERMMAAIKHRGPDDSGVLVRDNAGLGHQRLAVIDVSARGHQPMLLRDEDVAIVFNGEIYNFKELRYSLEEQGRKFTSDSDTEVLLHLYATQGDEFLENVSGMFAIALYDFKKKKLVLARDRMGEKPLYWTHQSGVFYFASELRALFETRIEKKIDEYSLQSYLQFDYVPTPHTMMQGVSKLEPATMLIFENGSTQKKTYWQPAVEKEVSVSEAIAHLDMVLAKSVTRQMVADVPIGIFLSGGIDSSTIAYYASRASSKKIHTFSIGFDDPSFDESGYAREAAQHLGTEHHELTMRERDALELIREIPEVFSEPVADTSVIPTMFLSRFARQSVTVALGGDGGDELFAGYPTFKADSFFSIYKHVPSSVHSLVLRGSELLPVSHSNFHWTYNVRKFLSSEAHDDTKRHLEWLGTFDDAARAGLAGASEDVFKNMDRHGGEVPGSTLNKLLYTYMRTYLMDQVLVKVDRASMRYALETRAPFLDHVLVEYVLSLPFSLKYRNGKGKYLLQEVMKDKLPSTLVYRKKKGFGIPLARWLTGPLRPLCEELLSKKALESHGLFGHEYVARLLSEHMSTSRDNRKELWNLLVFQMWFQRWLR